MSHISSVLRICIHLSEAPYFTGVFNAMSFDGGLEFRIHEIEIAGLYIHLSFFPKWDDIDMYKVHELIYRFDANRQIKGTNPSYEEQLRGM